MMSKEAVRAVGLKQRKSLSPQQRKLFSQAIMALLFEHLSVQSDRAGSNYAVRSRAAPNQTAANRIESLLTYRSMPSEVSTDAVLQYSSLRLYAPVTGCDASMSWKEVRPDTIWSAGDCAVPEPEGGELWQSQRGGSIVLCPMTAFDRQGGRLGMGKGYFDRWLSQYRNHLDQVIGLAFSCQEVAQVPQESHDMAMDYVITEQEVIACMNH
jgi:5-formyltetrahydrofolate cyclo-ligase